MDWKVTKVREATEYDVDRGFYRVKIVDFTVDGAPHTIKISMSDFDNGKIPDIVKKEAEKIIAAYGASGSGKTGR